MSCIFNPNLCKQITWRYAWSGSKTVTYTDENNNEVSKTVAVGSAGSCPAPCDASSAPPATFSLSSDTVLIGEQLHLRLLRPGQGLLDRGPLSRPG